MAWEYLDQGGLIFVGIPHRGQVSTAWAINLLRALGPYLQRVRVFTIQGHPIDVSREALVQQSLASNAEYIYFLDSDIYTRPDTLQGLMNSNLPIVSALYYRRHDLEVTDEMIGHLPEKVRRPLHLKREAGMPIFTPAIWKDFIYDDDEGNELRSFRPFFDGEFSPGQLVNVDALPMGCCLIRTEVFKKLPRPWFYWSLARYPPMLDNDISRVIQLKKGLFGCSEDMYFSLLARKHDQRLACNTSIVVQHESQVIINAEGRLDVVKA